MRDPPTTHDRLLNEKDQQLHTDSCVYFRDMLSTTFLHGTQQVLSIGMIYSFYLNETIRSRRLLQNNVVSVSLNPVELRTSCDQGFV